MYVLHVINNLVVGGAERFLLELATAQAAIGWRVGLLTLVEPNPLAAWARKDRMGYTCLGRTRLNDPRLLLDVRNALARERPDVVHTHLFYADFFGRLAARWMNVAAIVSTEHSTAGGTLSRKRQRGMRWTASIPHRLVAVSSAARDRMAERLGLDPSTLHVIPNGIHVEAWRSATARPRAELGFADDAFLVGSVGRLIESKAYDDLLRGVARLQDPRVQVVMVGDGPYADALRRLADELGLAAQVHWLGSRSDVAALLKMLDVFVLPSLWEGHSVALLEAMAAGCACVVSDIPELVETLGEAGVAFPRRDPERLARVLRSLLDAPDRRREYGVQAQRAAESYSIEKAAQRYASLYNEILGS